MAPRRAAIAGIHEYPLRRAPGRSKMQIKAESAARALADAGLTFADVDALYDAGETGAMSGITVAEHLGIAPRVIDTTSLGGSSYEFHAAHAARDIAAGRANVALLTYGSTAKSEAQGHRHRWPQRTRPGARDEHGDPLRAPADRQLRAGGPAAHARVRHHARAARRDRRHHPRARRAQPRGCRRTARPRDQEHRRAHRRRRAGLADGRRPAAPARLLHRLRRRRRGGDRRRRRRDRDPQASGLDPRQRRGGGLPGQRTRPHHERRRRGPRRSPSARRECARGHRHRDDLRLLHDHGADAARGPRLRARRARAAPTSKAAGCAGTAPGHPRSTPTAAACRPTTPACAGSSC